MKENSFTYTARSNENPEKTATFTLQNGSVSVQLGNAILEQLEGAADAHDPEEGINMVDWAKPMAAGAVQKMLRPLPVNDFDAAVDGNEFHATAWVRTGGLRLAPLTITWNDVDNPEAAQAFVKELNDRQKTAVSTHKLPSIFDYWATWIIASLSGLIFIAVMLRFFFNRSTADENIEPANA